ncbi:hypothetical protein [Microbacterium sp. AR7-10]|uniref:hypothetical protein n=1 Tax=Microbacterium sp. AR7-10 TaxID=1891970 RepID=UPI0008FC409C|nr:hypothetical protein [Microbacterium sp. AR7-10]OIU88671.1 hypothetical protein BFN01_04300 [Microbacterium sp. AR7-10]
MAWELVDNIRGPKGEKGDVGTIGSVSVATLPAGTPASVVMTGQTNKHVHFAVPQGEKGEQGLPGTLSSASAESVAAGDNAEVIMSGTTEVKHAHFKVPRGLPGVNAIENDAAVAAYVGAVDSDTRSALNEAYPTRLVWDGSAYPTRVPNAVNIFFGPVDPGLLMQPGDYWANPAVTTLAEVIAAMQNPNSGLRAATAAAMSPTAVDVAMTPRDGDTVLLKNVGMAGVELYGRELTADALLGLTGTVQVPSGWNTARVRISYYVPAGAGAGDVRVSRAAATLSDGSAPTAVTEVSNTIVAPAAGQFASALITGDITLTGKSRVSVTVKRNGNVAADTLPAPIFLVGVQLERMS